MRKIADENLLARILQAGAFFATVVVITANTTDPVNTPKLVALGVSAGSAIGVVIFSSLSRVLLEHKVVLAIVVIFMIAMALSVSLSEAPISQNIWGVYGRNNGLVTYVFLALILISSLCLSSQESFTRIIRALVAAGLVNIVYLVWVNLFGDPIGWENTYGNILGTLGNPNFIGAFLGIFLAVYIAFSLRKEASSYFRYSIVVVVPVTMYEIYESHAIQGRVVGAFGIGVLLFYFIRSKYGRLQIILYTVLTTAFGLIALLGALQIGPLTQYIYKTSVSLRGQYWKAGFNTGIDHPWFGVGMDAVGDWYRRKRDLHALELPGVNVVINASHNVPIDIFAFGGFPLLVSYLCIIIFTLRAIVVTTIRIKDFDPIFVGLVIAWSGYQLQSIISINQIGLAFWGWILSGSLIAYERSTRAGSISILTTEEKRVRKTNSKSASGEARVQLIAVMAASGLIGLLTSLPPLTADSKWRKAQLSYSAVALEDSMKSSYFNPQNNFKYLTNIQLLEQSQLFELSHKYAQIAVQYNPDAYELWKVYFLLKNSTEIEKALALQNMKRLDPLNPDVTSIR